MNLNASQFSSLSQDDQLEYIMQHSVFIGERSDEIFRYLLHNIDGTYIEEVRFLRNNAWVSYMCTDDFNILVKYTGEVKLQFQVTGLSSVVSRFTVAKYSYTLSLQLNTTKGCLHTAFCYLNGAGLCYKLFTQNRLLNSYAARAQYFYYLCNLTIHNIV